MERQAAVAIFWSLIKHIADTTDKGLGKEHPLTKIFTLFTQSGVSEPEEILGMLRKADADRFRERFGIFEPRSLEYYANSGSVYKLAEFFKKCEETYVWRISILASTTKPPSWLKILY